MKRQAKKIIRLALIYVALSTIAFVAIFPYVWMVLTSFKTRVDAFAIPPVWFFKPGVGHYLEVFVRKGFSQNLLNSLIISLSSTALSLIVGVPSAYAFARYKLYGDHHMFFFILTTRMAPPITIALPLYILMARAGVLNTHFSVIIAHTTFNLALVVWLMRGFFRMIPREIEEAALIDGCSTFRVFSEISLPLSSGGLVATAIFCIIMSWNEFLFAMILGGHQAATLTMAVPGLVTTRGTFWGQIAAVGTVTTIPILIFSLLVQKHLVRGLTFGAIEG